MRRTLLSLALTLGVFCALILPLTLSAQEPAPESLPALVQEIEAAETPAPSLASHASRLHPSLLKQMLQHPDDAFLSVIVEWRQESQRRLQEIPATGDPRQHRRMVVAALQAEANQASAALRSVVATAEQQGEAQNVRSFWVSPVMAMDARPDLLDRLAQRQDVVQIRLDERIYLDAQEMEPAAANTVGWPWNLTMVRADQAQNALGLDGTGVVVAIMDTGVEWQHPALEAKYRGYTGKDLTQHRGNWHVSTDETYLYPGDAIGHGTHVMGTILGDDGLDNRIGVAPGAKWIAVKLFHNEGYTEESWIHDAFEWIMAPEGNPDLAPDVVNNSWGSNEGEDDRFREDVAAWRAAGILPIFSAGNDGPQQNTVGSPASFPEALAVGAVDSERLVASFSSRGPSPWQEIKPEISAPGVAVRSAYPGGDYALLRGTSMAAPHVTGIVALLLQANPNLTPDQLETILVNTAQPLTGTTPNNFTGHGLVDAYGAGVQVTARGELIGQVNRTGGVGVIRPTVTISRRDGLSFQIQGDATGTFTTALQPGLYDVTASAFGLEPATRFGVSILVGQRATTTVDLALRPTGSIFGRIIDARTGGPLSATITISGTPVSVQSDPNSGIYGLALPEGEWHVRVEADGHRIGRLHQTIQAGTGETHDFTLEPAPRILLVDSGRWYYASQIQSYLQTLETLDYAVHLWTVRNPFGFLPIPMDSPTLETMQQYDILIWSAPLDSPGFVNADAAMLDYLLGGGKVLLAGPDIAYWDGGGTIFGFTRYFPFYLYFAFNGEETVEKVTGVPDSPLADLEILLNQQNGLVEQPLVDTIRLRNTIISHPMLTRPDGQMTGATSSVCRPWRASWLGFGLEGVEQTSRAEILTRLLPWFDQPPPTHAVDLLSASNPMVARSGDPITHTIALYNLGTQTDTFGIEVVSGEWPIQLTDDTGQSGSSLQLELGSCSRRDITATVRIPSETTRNTGTRHQLRMRSFTVPGVSKETALYSKTPAAVILVDDERFYNNDAQYTQSLDRLGIEYDLFNTNGGDTGPDLDLLTQYDLAIWYTGYDWFSPLTSGEEEMLGRYLLNGGRLLLSSQDMLDISGPTDFNRTFLGVLASTLTVTPTQVSPIPDNPILPGQQVIPLQYPFPNWSDGLAPGVGSQALLYDQNSRIVGVSTRGPQWRTAFFSFPLESMQPEPLTALLGQTTLWLSPFRGSRLTAPPAVDRTQPIPISLQVTAQDTAHLNQARIHLPIPTDLSILTGSVAGGWQITPNGDGLSWEGNLQSNLTRTLTAQLQINPSATSLVTIPLQAHLFAGNGLTVTARTLIHIDTPWFTLEKKGGSLSAQPGQEITFSLHLQNQGVLQGAAMLTDSLPLGLALLPATLHADVGQATANNGELFWQGSLLPGQESQIQYRGVITLTQQETGAILYNRVYLAHGSQRISDYTTTIAPAWRFLPILSGPQPELPTKNDP